MNNAARKISDKRRNRNVLPIGYKLHFVTIISAPIYKPRNSPTVKVRRFYRVRCECGTELDVAADALNNGKRVSCSCKSKERLAEARYKHGGHRGKGNGGSEKLYSRWIGMKSRCYCETNPSYKNYGERGIVVCDEWRKDYGAFRKWATDNGFADCLEIDRIDNDGPYSPDNCRFVPKATNMLNTSRNRFLTAFGETKTVTEWSKDYRCHAKHRSITSRIDVLGWDVEKALSTPTKVTNRVSINDLNYIEFQI